MGVHRVLTVTTRYRLQATATQGLAADIDTKDGLADSLAYWHPLCTHRWPPSVG